jgi:hypothetical protein
MLTFTRTGRLHFGDDLDPSALPAYFAKVLQNVDAREVKAYMDRVEFKGGMFRLVSSWNVLVPFASGTVTIHPDIRQVRYRVSYLQLVFVATIAVGIMSLFVLSSVGWQPLLVVPIVWLWLVGGNLIIGVPRFERFIRRALADLSSTEIKAGSVPKHASDSGDRLTN